MLSSLRRAPSRCCSWPAFVWVVSVAPVVGLGDPSSASDRVPRRRLYGWTYRQFFPFSVAVKNEALKPFLRPRNTRPQASEWDNGVPTATSWPKQPLS